MFSKIKYQGNEGTEEQTVTGEVVELDVGLGPIGVEIGVGGVQLQRPGVEINGELKVIVDEGLLRAPCQIRGHRSERDENRKRRRVDGQIGRRREGVGKGKGREGKRSDARPAAQRDAMQVRRRCSRAFLIREKTTDLVVLCRVNSSCGGWGSGLAWDQLIPPDYL